MSGSNTESRPDGRLLTPGEVAERLQIRENTLAVWRMYGRGPSYIKVGARVRYRWDEVEQWLATQTH